MHFKYLFGILTLFISSCSIFAFGFLGNSGLCRNGVLNDKVKNGEVLEECDDGNDIDGDGCDTNCTLSACQNGIFASGELCFLTHQEFAKNTNPSDIAVVDFNNDGVLDILATDENTGEILLLLGVASDEDPEKPGFETLSYGEPIRFDIGATSLTSISTADLNDDGFIDVVVTAPAEDSTFVLLGDGEGFPENERQLIRVGFAFGSRHTALDNLNGDTILDLVIINSDSNDFNVLLGKGDGFFDDVKTPQTIDLGPGGEDVQPIFVATGLLDDKNGTDIIVVNTFQDSLVISNVDDGTFSTTNSFELPETGEAASVLVEDINSDGNFDILIPKPVLDDLIQIFLGNEDGDFLQQENLEVGDDPFFVISQDFNGDEILDLVVANASSNDLSLILGKGEGGFEEQQFFPVGLNPFVVEAADVNNDGIDDLVVANKSFDFQGNVFSNGGSIGVILFEP